MQGGQKIFADNKWLAAAFGGMIILGVVSSPTLAKEPAVPPGQVTVSTGTSPDQCSEFATLLAKQEQNNSREFRQIKRDIAALNQQVTEPGMREIFGGVGYILGLFGVAAYVASRKKTEGGGR
jgi:hypothetical protein